MFGLKNKKDKKEKDEKKNLPGKDELEEIGLSSSHSSSNISIHNESGTYVSHASISEVKRGYGTIQEYLKQRFGPGRYTITIRGKNGEDTQHISIAGDEPTQENPLVLSGIDGNNLMGIYGALQAENARLKAELDVIKQGSQQSLLGQIITPAIDFIKTMMQSRPETDLASVMTAATECLKTLSEIRTPGEKDDMGGLMSGIAQFMQGFQQRPQPQPMPNPIYIPVPQQPQMVAPQPQQTSSPASPVNPVLNIQSAPTAPTPNNNGYTDIFFESLLGMMEQKQQPKTVAEYIVQSIQKIPPQEIAKLDPQMQVLIGQLQANPVTAFDAILQIEPDLATDGKYVAEIRSELQKIVQG